jgi:uncharacterized C2H2 Zn-finger protein
LKILLLDVETAPNLVHVWGLWQQNVGLPQIIDSGYILCWSAKWFGENQIFFDSLEKTDAKLMLAKIHSLLNDADVVVHYNGTKFDIPTLNKEFILHGFTPPSPYRQIDLLRTARNVFKFPSNKLDYIAQALGLGGKVKNRGHELWIGCMANDPQCWGEMEEYNKQDVILLELLYNKMKPWIKPHPNYTLYTDEIALMCPICGATNYHRRGYAYTAAGKYQRFRCTACGSWFKDRKNLSKKQTVQA